MTTTCYDIKLKLLHNITAVSKLVQSASTNKGSNAVFASKSKRDTLHTSGIDSFITDAKVPAVDAEGFETEDMIQTAPVPARVNAEVSGNLGTEEPAQKRGRYFSAPPRPFM